jgi:hypothetical protein
MTTEEVGVVSSIVGSVAVVLSLCFLAYQVNRARRELARENARAMIRHNDDILLSLSDDPNLLDVHIRGLKSFENLTDAERLKWGIWLFTWITQSEQGFIDRKQRDFSGLNLDQYLEGLALTLRSAGGKAMWPRLKQWFDPSFCEALERQVATSSTTLIDQMADLAWQPPPPAKPR